MSKLLLVDDTKDVRELFEFAFKEAGVDYLIFENGGDALSYLWKNGEDVGAAILDLAMPVEDGLTLAKRIRENEALYEQNPVPLFFLTAYPITRAVLDIGQEVNVKKIFSKTDDPDTIISEVQSKL